MIEAVRIELLPAGKTIEVAPGAALQDVLFAHGVEFPCGGRGRCRGCRIKVLEGLQPPTAEDQLKFSPEELAQGWRLSCRIRCETDLKIELAQWEAAILADDSVFAFTPRQGFGIAVDLGTTTLVAQLVDLHHGHVLAVRTALNPQARHGADIMSRVEYATHGHQALLTHVIRTRIGEMIEELIRAAQMEPTALNRVCIVGNTVMHHLFCGIDVQPLAAVPFEPVEKGLQVLNASRLGWTAIPSASVYFLPCMGSFVGSDILAGLLATGLHQRAELTALVDLGTNGEIVVGNSQRMLCASTAAGPAFEGARISMGMRATTGAISEVNLGSDKRFECRVLGNTKPAGFCGSGLVDAVACALDLGMIQPSGRIPGGNPITVAPPVSLNQKDVRELQFAKGAIAAGIRMLLAQLGAKPEDLTRIYLAGAFGNYINRASARRIGLLQFPVELIEASGNTALLGAKISLFNPDEDQFHYAELLQKVHHVSLNEDLEFQNVYAEEMGFPSA